MNIDDDYMLFMLNTLGQTYNSSSGFNVKNKIVADRTDIRFKNFVEECFIKKYRITNSEGYNIYDLSEISNNDPLYFDVKFLEEKSKMSVIYDLVILKYPNNCKNKNKIHNIKEKYINFNEKESKVTLSSLSKWDSITIEDILYATSKMTTDENKMIVDLKDDNKRKKYRKISKSGNYSIILEPGII